MCVLGAETSNFVSKAVLRATSAQSGKIGPKPPYFASVGFKTPSKAETRVKRLGVTIFADFA